MAVKPQTVLVVEDEASIASFVAAYLKNAGYTVRTTASGTEALYILAPAKPPLASLALLLPTPAQVELSSPPEIDPPPTVLPQGPSSASARTRRKA